MLDARRESLFKDAQTTNRESNSVIGMKTVSNHFKNDIINKSIDLQTVTQKRGIFKGESMQTRTIDSTFHNSSSVIKNDIVDASTGMPSSRVQLPETSRPSYRPFIYQ